MIVRGEDHIGRSALLEKKWELSNPVPAIFLATLVALDFTPVSE